MVRVDARYLDVIPRVLLVIGDHDDAVVSAGTTLASGRVSSWRNSASGARRWIVIVRVLESVSIPCERSQLRGLALHLRRREHRRSRRTAHRCRRAGSAPASGGSPPAGRGAVREADAAPELEDVRPAVGARLGDLGGEVGHEPRTSSAAGAPISDEPIVSERGQPPALEAVYAIGSAQLSRQLRCPFGAQTRVVSRRMLGRGAWSSARGVVGDVRGLRHVVGRSPRSCFPGLAWPGQAHAPEDAPGASSRLP